jgi:ADP-heptose:LPS heptosyltransferase
MTGLSGIGAPLLSGVTPERIAVFRALQLGDMLCAVPALRALRGALPSAHITLVGLPWAAQFVRRYARYLDDFIAFPGHPGLPEQPIPAAHDAASFYEAMRERRYDLAIQLHGSGEISNQIVRAFEARLTVGHTIDDGDDPGMFARYTAAGTEPERLLRLVEFLGATPQGLDLEFPIGEDDERELAESGLAERIASGNYICVHPGARVRRKCWPPQCFAQVADRLAEEFGVAVVLTGSQREADLTHAVATRMRSPSIDAALPISIGAMAALMRRSRLLVCNDTGVSHIAAGMRLPSVVIFSAADILRWAPANRVLHRSLWDPDGLHVPDVIAHARALLT